jgi:hypothetical protein
MSLGKMVIKIILDYEEDHSSILIRRLSESYPTGSDD